MNYNLTSFVIASMVVIVFMGSTATVAAKSNQLLRGGRAGRQLEKGNDDTILIPPFTATTNTTYADDTSVSGHSHTTSSSSNDTSNSSTINFTEEECDDCYFDEGSEGGCTICYYPKICWGDMHSSYCGYDTDDTDDGS